jgi:chromosome segregation ATPase
MLERELTPPEQDNSIDIENDLLTEKQRLWNLQNEIGNKQMKYDEVIKKAEQKIKKISSSRYYKIFSNYFEQQEAIISAEQVLNRLKNRWKDLDNQVNVILERIEEIEQDLKVNR